MATMSQSRALEDEENDTSSKAKARMSMRDVVIKFMNTRLDGEIHEALNVHKKPAVEYEQRLNIWKQATTPQSDRDLASEAARTWKKAALTLDFEKLYAESTAAQKRFLLAMQDYQKTADEKYQVNLDITGIHSWDQVLDIVDDAEKQYSDDALQGRLGKVRKAFRKFSEHAKTAQCFTVLLPTQSNYSSILCGGVKLILGAAQNLGEVRDSVADAVETIPTILEDTREVVEIYWDEAALHMAASALYVSLLVLLEHILVWFKEKAAKKVLKAAFKQDLYKKSLLGKVGDLKKRVDRFNKQALTCQMREIKDIRYELNTFAQTSKMAQFDQLAAVQNVGSNVQKVNSNVQNLSQDQALIMSKLDALTAMADLLKSELIDNINKPPLLGVEKDRSAKVSRCRLRASTILDQFNFDPNLVAPNLDPLLQLSGTLDLSQQDRTTELMRDSTLRHWVNTDNSTALLVNGHSTNISRSPVTLTCAILMNTIYRTAQSSPNLVIPLCFFCGEHLNADQDEDAHPQGMMLTLLAQLLVAHPDFNFSPVEKLWNKLIRDEEAAGSNIRAICKLFESLIQQLPSYAKVFCIIDGISHYEDWRRLDATVEAIERLVSMVHKSHRRTPIDEGYSDDDDDDEQGHKGPLIKLLVTSPSSCNHVWKSFDSQNGEVLDMQWQYSRMNQGGYKLSEWDGGAGRDLELNV